MDALGEFARPESVKLLSDLLAADNPSLRHRAIAALGRTGMHDALAPLLARLRDAEGIAERAAIVDALAQLRDPSALDALLEELESAQDQALRIRITIALGAIPRPERLRCAGPDAPGSAAGGAVLRDFRG